MPLIYLESAGHIKSFNLRVFSDNSVNPVNVIADSCKSIGISTSTLEVPAEGYNTVDDISPVIGCDCRWSGISLRNKNKIFSYIKYVSMWFHKPASYFKNNSWSCLGIKCHFWKYSAYIHLIRLFVTFLINNCT